MTTKEFEAFMRSVAKPIVKFRRGEIDGDALYEDLYVILGKETITETEKLIEEAKTK